VIITCRASEEAEDSTSTIRYVFGCWSKARDRRPTIRHQPAHYCKFGSPDISRLIVSYHNFDETPADIDAVYDRVTALPAAVHKIVTRANTITDSLAIFKLLERARVEGKHLIAMAMGQTGIITRVLGPSHGSFLPRVSASGKESAEGQLLVKSTTSVEFGD
jgi:3-dehydroquinate dehydratase type I